MPETELPAVTYESLNDLLAPLQIILDPAELHGILCGKFCGGANPSETDWLLEAVEELDFTQPPDGTVRAALTALFLQTRQQIAQQEFDVQLLVPGDNDDIGRRVSCLSRWCQGFLVGFGAAGKVGEAELSPQAKEALEDLAAIGLVSLDEDDAEAMRAAENDYMEVLEYVRMAVSALFMEFGSEQVAPTCDEPPSTVH
jgi:uncharacterized protein